MNSSEYPYVDVRQGVHYVRGSRIPLESLIWLWRDGYSAETIREAYPTLRLAEVYGALAYYLDHVDEVNRELSSGSAEFETQRTAAMSAERARYITLSQRFAAVRDQQTAS